MTHQFKEHEFSHHPFEKMLQDCDEEWWSESARRPVQGLHDRLDSIGLAFKGTRTGPLSGYSIECGSAEASIKLDAASLLQAIRDSGLTIAELGRLRRSFAHKHHPDRLQDAELKRQAHCVLADINAALDAKIRSKRSSSR